MVGRSWKVGWELAEKQPRPGGYVQGTGLFRTLSCHMGQAETQKFPWPQDPQGLGEILRCTYGIVMLIKVRLGMGEGGSREDGQWWGQASLSHSAVESRSPAPVHEA